MKRTVERLLAVPPSTVDAMFTLMRDRLDDLDVSLTAHFRKVPYADMNLRSGPLLRRQTNEQASPANIPSL